MEKLFFGQPLSYYEEKSAGLTAVEIERQPKLWRQLADDFMAQQEKIGAFMSEVLQVHGLRTVFTGAGSSAFIGETMMYLLAGEMGLRSENVHTTDIVASPDSTLPDVPTLLISYARSGESPESMAAVQFAKKKISRLYNIIVVCDGNSSLAKLGRETEHTLVLVMPEGSCDKGFAMTSSVSCMLLATWCLFHYKEAGKYTAYVKLLADSAEKEMDSLASAAQAVAGMDYRRIIWLGCGALKGIAREAAVKSMELTNGYTHAGYDAPTGFRHGPKTVVDDTTLTVHLVSSLAYTRQYDNDFIKEMISEQKANKIVTVKAKAFDDEAVKGDISVLYELPDGLPENSEMAAAIKALLFIQLLSLMKSLALGYTTDNPCPKGEVNRVVQGVVIYPV